MFVCICDTVMLDGGEVHVVCMFTEPLCIVTSYTVLQFAFECVYKNTQQTWYGYLLDSKSL